MPSSASQEVHPGLFLVLNLPLGLAGGFLAITFPYLATRAGLSVAASGAVVAAGVLSFTVQFLWSPVIDATLSLKRWQAIGAMLSALSVIALAAAPRTASSLGLLTLLAACLGVSSTIVGLSLAGLIAGSVPDDGKGRAAGWMQAGNLGGIGLGGGAGVFITAHTGSPLLAGAVVGVLCLATCAGLLLIDEPVRDVAKGAVAWRLKQVAGDLKALFLAQRGRLTMLLLATPIGVGAASNLFSAMAGEWQASPDLIALTTGPAGAGASALGALAGGWLADRLDRLNAFVIVGAQLVLAGAALALAPRTPAIFVAGTLGYVYAVGCCYAVYSAVILEAIGRGAATSKFAVLNAFGNLPLAYMTAFDGLAHDRCGTTTMLELEAGICAIGLALIVLLRKPSGWDRPEAKVRSA